MTIVYRIPHRLKAEKDLKDPKSPRPISVAVGGGRSSSLTGFAESANTNGR